MMILSNVKRLLQIQRVVGRYQLQRLLPRQTLLRLLLRINPWAWQVAKAKTRGACLRCALVDLGPIFVKFGQALSTRRDLIPLDIADELAKLQDQVPAFAGEEAQAIIEKAYAKPLDEIFASFDLQALASASIAQVHVAELLDGKEAIVKVLRPKIKKRIQKDIALLYFLARLLERFSAHGPRLRPQELVREFEYTILDELDLSREAASATQLRRNFPDSPMIYVPQIYWPYVRSNVLVMERIYGVPISNIAELKRCNVNMKKLAEYGVEIFFTQVFRDSFFHADMHPGNIFVDISDPENPRYKAVDFGIMGSLDREDQRYLAENLLAFFNRDYRRVAELHIESGWVPADTRVAQFEAAVRSVCEPIFELPMCDISFARVLLQLFQTASRFQMPIQPQLMLLQKTLFNVEGLGRELYPELDLWNTAKPFLQRWLKQQLGVKAFLRQVRRNSPYWLEKLPELPDLVYRGLRQLDNVQDHTVNMPKQYPLSLGVALALLSSSAAIIIGFAVEHGLGTALVLKISAGLLAAGLLSAVYGLLKR